LLLRRRQRCLPLLTSKLFPLELAAGCLNVVSSGAADIDLQALDLEELLKPFDLGIVWSPIGTTGMDERE
jgi:hypothetical protein